MPMPAQLPDSHLEIQLDARPQEEFDPGRHLRTVRVPLPVPGPGQALVRNRMMSVTAVMRTLMLDDPGVALPMPRYEPGEPLWGPALGEVVSAPAEGGGPGPGESVTHSAGWREYAAVDAGKLSPVASEGPAALPDPAAHLSQGFTAWLGVVRAAGVRPGDTVFVSGAAGGVGSLTGQFARLHGAARVIGSTGSPHKARVLTEELGYDAVVLRGTGRPFAEQLREAAPGGVDAVVDNVGGEQLEAALAVARQGARIGLIGSLSSQVPGDTSAKVPLDTFSLLSRDITLRGVPAFAHLDAYGEWQREFAHGLRTGALAFPHVRRRGIAQAPQALGELLEGRHLGAVLVEL